MNVEKNAIKQKDVSIFDLAEVWVPTRLKSDCLSINSSIKSTESNASLNEFAEKSGKCLIKFCCCFTFQSHCRRHPNPISGFLILDDSLSARAGGSEIKVEWWLDKMSPYCCSSSSQNDVFAP